MVDEVEDGDDDDAEEEPHEELLLWMLLSEELLFGLSRASIELLPVSMLLILRVRVTFRFSSVSTTFSRKFCAGEETAEV